MDKIANSKTALVFAGQGAQYSGMGRELYKQNEAAWAVFEKAEHIRPGICDLCFDGAEEDLRQTVNAQPAIFCVDMAAALALSTAGFKPDMLAGFSLGELAALTYSGALNLTDGLKLVCERGRLMQQASEQHPSLMLAVLKLDNQAVEELCKGFAQVYPVNYNGPGQLIVAGRADEAERFAQAVKQAGGRAMPLPVSGGFHCPFMAEAAAGFAEFITNFSIGQPRIPMYANYTAQPYADNIRELLFEQIINPVRWQTIVENMAAAGADTFVEVGPGHTLSNLIAKIAPQARLYHVEDMESLQKTVEGLGLCSKEKSLWSPAARAASVAL